MSEKLKITKIGSKARKRIITLSDGRELTLCREIVEKYRLIVGAGISVEHIGKIRIESDLIEAGNYAEYLLSRREYSVGLLRNKLFDKGFEAGIINRIILKLKQAKLVDDDRFARLAVEAVMRRKPAGRRFLSAYLRSKYISGSVAETVLNELFENTDQNELALRLLRGRIRQYAKFDLETARRKAYNYLSQRAISYDAARFAFEKIRKELEQERKD